MLQSLGRLRIDGGGNETPHAHPLPSGQMADGDGELAEEDEAAVNRLTSLGFSRTQVRSPHTGPVP